MKIKFLVILMTSMLVMTGCSSDEEPLLDEKIENNDSGTSEGNKEYNTHYYVKYEVYMPLGWSNQTTTRIINYVTETGGQTLTTSNSSWEGTFGPLKKGTTVSLSVRAGSGGIRNNVEYYVRLYVSYNKEPFVLKGEDRGTSVSSLFTSYTIDF